MIHLQNAPTRHENDREVVNERLDEGSNRSFAWLIHSISAMAGESSFADSPASSIFTWGIAEPAIPLTEP